MTSKVCWRSTGFSSLRVEAWDEEFTVFQPGSGKTHFLNQMGLQIISSLDQSPASADDICRFLSEQFQVPYDQNFLWHIMKTLHRFDELGLIKKME
ncbi:HPr-rel-A system PqqD family peptide chaperone [Nitrosospira multiformis]|uniref:HPr-rel-A system PqqD family peptide chaperone n=1 Tax=Nitrosospira multiformis TaxID=1231 RepID=UPI000943504A|nr:HPr-rel-A system PqqD family peptide chaperone [Nitrosospira multiformis]